MVAPKKPDCLVADSVKEIKNETLNIRGLHLYLRSSGFSEREHFFELYDDAPLFNDCGLAAIDLLSQVHVDTSLGAPEKLIVKSNKLDIEYTTSDFAGGLQNVVIMLD